MELQQLRASQVQIGDYLLNLGEVTKVHQADRGVRFTFKESLARIFPTHTICYVRERDSTRCKKWVGEDGKPSTRERAKARKGVSVE